jgi:hypothetical protein
MLLNQDANTWPLLLQVRSQRQCSMAAEMRRPLLSTPHYPFVRVHACFCSGRLWSVCLPTIIVFRQQWGLSDDEIRRDASYVTHKSFKLQCKLQWFPLWLGYQYWISVRCTLSQPRLSSSFGRPLAICLSLQDGCNTSKFFIMSLFYK